MVKINIVEIRKKFDKRWDFICIYFVSLFGSLVAFDKLINNAKIFVI